MNEPTIPDLTPPVKANKANKAPKATGNGDVTPGTPDAEPKEPRVSRFKALYPDDATFELLVENRPRQVNVTVRRNPHAAPCTASPAPPGVGHITLATAGEHPHWYQQATNGNSQRSPNGGLSCYPVCRSLISTTSFLSVTALKVRAIRRTPVRLKVVMVVLPCFAGITSLQVTPFGMCYFNSKCRKYAYASLALL